MIGLYLNDLEEGRIIALGQHHFTREKVLEFARKYDPQPFHLDDDAAERGPFGKLSASGWHTAAGWMACFVATNTAARQALLGAGKTLPEIGPSPGFTDMRWLKSVYPGDTVTYRCTITAKRLLASRPGWGLLTAHNEGFNQHGELVFTFTSKVLTAA